MVSYIEVTTSFKKNKSATVEALNFKVLCDDESYANQIMENHANFIKSVIGKRCVIVNQMHSMILEKDVDASMHSNHERNMAPGY